MSVVSKQVMVRSKLLLFFIGLFFFQSISAQYKIPEKPTFQTSVYDYVEGLTATQKARLENKLIRYSDTTSSQIVIVIINSTKGESIGMLAPRWGQKWGVGQAKKDNGVFVLLAKEDRKIWISPGYGVEHLLTAGVTGELTRQVIIPEFKKGNYYVGLDKGSDAIFQVLTGAYTGTRKKGSNNDFNLAPIIFIVFIIVFLILRRRGGGRRGSVVGSVFDAIILSNMGRGNYGSGGSFGGGSSGGFGGGFGGGGFSGGGAGGSW
ncbi:MAG: TPM domain-containing protein [Polaribacter sp.]|nr:TPM domain-containing protein [Polaribacter sp.]